LDFKPPQMSSSNPIASQLNPPAAPHVLTTWEIPGLVHGFCGRTGGVSTGPFATFNLAGWVGDAPDAVAANWRRWRLLHPHLPVDRVRQVHGNLVHHIDSVPRAVGPPHVGPEGDGMVTAAASLALGIFTADCVPLLMVDAERRVVAALHAGWRGTLAGIAAEGVHAMVVLGARPASIRAALGPSIGLCCFEVDAVLAETFAREIPGAAALARFGGHLPPETPAAERSVRRSKAYLDLRAILRLQLEREGLKPASITSVGPCTRCANDLFFSRRGAGGVTSGLQMSFIGFAP
jgi:YfiH family protein